MSRKNLLMGLLMVAMLGTVTGCEIIPGIEEPSIWICPITNLDKNDPEFGDVTCYHSFDSNVLKQVKVLDLIGFQCVSPKSFSKIKSHHSILHKELNKAKKQNGI